jgi:hypothetical protein
VPSDKPASSQYNHAANLHTAIHSFVTASLRVRPGVVAGRAAVLRVERARRFGDLPGRTRPGPGALPAADIGKVKRVSARGFALANWFGRWEYRRFS